MGRMFKIGQHRKNQIRCWVISPLLGLVGSCFPKRVGTTQNKTFHTTGNSANLEIFHLYSLVFNPDWVPLQPAGLARGVDDWVLSCYYLGKTLDANQEPILKMDKSSTVLLTPSPVTLSQFKSDLGKAARSLPENSDDSKKNALELVAWMEQQTAFLGKNKQVLVLEPFSNTQKFLSWMAWQGPAFKGPGAVSLPQFQLGAMGAINSLNSLCGVFNTACFTKLLQENFEDKTKDHLELKDTISYKIWGEITRNLKFDYSLWSEFLIQVSKTSVKKSDKFCPNLKNAEEPKLKTIWEEALQINQKFLTKTTQIQPK